MTLPRGRVGTTNPYSHSSRPGSDERLENTPSSSRNAGLSPLHTPPPYLTPAAQQFSPSRLGYVFPETTDHFFGQTSANSSTMNTPLASRSPSPLPPFYSPALSSGSDTDSDEPASPLLLDTYPTSYLREGLPRWWQLRQRSRRRPRRPSGWGYRSIVRVLRRVFRHPFFPKHPSTILLSLLFFSVLALSITLLLIHLLNPDKEPLPWRAYCTVPETSATPPPLNAHPTFLNISVVASAPPIPSFPPSNFDSLPPVGVFVGVFSMDSSSERRMLIRSTWASHRRSRNGAGDGDGGAGTSRTIVRFIMGQPRKTWDRRVRVEMQEYNDIIILPTPENMNSGKTHSFFTWAASMAWVPPLYFDTETPLPNFSYSNESSPVPSLAQHDPVHAWWDRTSGSSTAHEWVRPDFVVKMDDDSFVMLAELEARLRIALHEKNTESVGGPRWDNVTSVVSAGPGAKSSLSTPALTLPSSSGEPQPRSPPGAILVDDPLIYWGYLVKRRFMAGELYALSWSLVDWVSKDPVVKGLVRGAEDKQTAKWMRLHPRAAEVRWVAERCWIYDHPRSGTVYSHGFLFPSEAARAREGVRAFFNKKPESTDLPTVTTQNWYDRDWGAPPEWARSSVTTFGTRYSLPLPDLTIPQSIEALVEGSDMSRLFEGSVWSAEEAWQRREGRKKRYNGQRLGGTIVVHFIKKHMWFFETSLTLLEGEEETGYEIQRRILEERRRAGATALSQTTNLHRTHLNGGLPHASSLLLAVNAY